jgi:7-carboxy-7-deazaguanine synthase
MLNSQPIEKSVQDPSGALEVHSIFYTIQGEGPYTGKPAVFVRLAGCNLQCPGCDTDYTSEREIMSAQKLHDEVYALWADEHPNAPRPMLVITGGEPFRQNIAPFANTMLVKGWVVQVETNGTLPPPQGLHDEVCIVCSPKTGKMNVLTEVRVTALKYVVKSGCIDRKDGLPIRSLDHTCSPTVAKPPVSFKGTIYLQPMDEGNPHANRANLNAAVNACKAYGHTLQIQTHKVAGIE